MFPIDDTGSQTYRQGKETNPAERTKQQPNGACRNLLTKAAPLAVHVSAFHLKESTIVTN